MAPEERIKIKNKERRKELFAALKKEKNKARHKLRAERAKEERANPELKEERLAQNVPDTIESLDAICTVFLA